MRPNCWARCSKLFQPVKLIQLTFIETWCAIYIGYHNILRTDKVFELTSNYWKQLSTNGVV